MYEVYGKIYKTKITRVGYKNFRLNRSQLYELINSGRIKILFLPNPNQPIENKIRTNVIKS